MSVSVKRACHKNVLCGCQLDRGDVALCVGVVSIRSFYYLPTNDYWAVTGYSAV